MIDLCIAIAWIVMSAAGMKGLSVLTQTVAMNNAEVELASYMGEVPPTFQAHQTKRASIDSGQAHS